MPFLETLASRWKLAFTAMPSLAKVTCRLSRAATATAFALAATG